MVVSAPPYALGLRTPTREHPKTPLTVQGVLPAWLRGTLVRTGPGQFEVNGESYQHWFDGLTVLVGFDFSDAGIAYSSRFLRSGSYCDAQAHHETLADVATEFPRINYRRCNGQPYQFVYGGENGSGSKLIDRLVKVDVQTGEVLTWQAACTYPSEPVFVASPQAAAEDQGVLLSVVLDGRQQKSFLLVLDAQTMQELARAEIPQIIPFGLHGQYFEDPDSPAASPHLHR